MPAPTVGILLVQLGTPDAPTAPALRRYLREFLSDPRVIEAPRLVWWLVLNLIILPFRPRRSAALYRRVWTERGSPLLLTTREQARLLEAELGPFQSPAGGAADGAAGYPKVRVEVGMRYGNPSIGAGLDRLSAAGVDRVLVFPLFPQYSAVTTASVHDAVARHLRKRRVVPAIRQVPPFPDDPAYIRALAARVREEIERLPYKPARLLVSYHGVPKSYVEKGDPYRAHVELTTRLLAEALGLGREEYILTFQSRFGPQEWLKPYTDETLEALGAGGTKRIAAVCPAFVTDCLETIDEIGREGARRFREAGGEELHLIPCLNVHPEWIRAMAEIARRELSGWI
jgi:ferrochelatase